MKKQWLFAIVWLGFAQLKGAWLIKFDRRPAGLAAHLALRLTRQSSLSEPDKWNLSSEACLAFPAFDALREGYNPERGQVRFLIC